MLLRSLHQASRRLTAKQIHTTPLASMTQQLLKAIVTHERGDNRIALKFSYDFGTKVRSFNLNRAVDEDLSIALSRVEMNILKHSKNKKKRKQVDYSTKGLVSVKMLKSAMGLSDRSIQLNDLSLSEVSGECSCLEAFVSNGEQHLLRIEDYYYSLDINPPTVVAAALPDCIMVGHLLYPNNLDVRFASVENCNVSWYISCKTFDNYNQAKATLHTMKWEEVHQGFLLTTTKEMSQKLLKAVIVPREGDRCGLQYEAVARALVEAGPEAAPYLDRHKHTATHLPHHSVRVVSYNLLADTYASTSFSAEQLFPTCPSYALDIAYRKQLFIDEILGYHADLVCLQEVDESVFHKDLSPVLALQSPPLLGRYAGKNSDSTKEGPATFYNTAKFRLLESLKHSISEELASNPALAHVWERVTTNDKLQERVTGRNTVLQTCVLERLQAAPTIAPPAGSGSTAANTEGKGDTASDGNTDTANNGSSSEQCNTSNNSEYKKGCTEGTTINNIADKESCTDSSSTSANSIAQQEGSSSSAASVQGKDIVVVANSHFYFHPDADHIRLLQSVVCFTLLEQLVSKLKEQGAASVRCVFCGDLNSTPDTGVYQLATEGHVQDSHVGWSSAPDEEVSGVSSSHRLRMASACGTPAYTNYVVAFNGCLDWIFYQTDHFSLQQMVPLPSHEQVTAHTALPSVTIPSDHLALVADLAYREPQ